MVHVQKMSLENNFVRLDGGKKKQNFLDRV